MSRQLTISEKALDAYEEYAEQMDRMVGSDGEFKESPESSFPRNSEMNEFDGLGAFPSQAQPFTGFSTLDSAILRRKEVVTQLFRLLLDRNTNIAVAVS